MRLALPLVAALAALLPAAPHAVAQDAASGLDAMEVVADLTLIDGACRNVLVNLGVGLRFAAAHGVPAAAILPGGARRGAFEAVLRARRDALADEELCGTVANNYAEALPASVVAVADPAGRRP